jgi:hypothetical protein
MNLSYDSFHAKNTMLLGLCKSTFLTKMHIKAHLLNININLEQEQDKN